MLRGEPGRSLNHRRGSRARGNPISTPDQIDAWRRDLKVKITWALVAKLLGLMLLWLLFFKPHAP
jgi:hypothetical protein